jgi:hypothetical protein
MCQKGNNINQQISCLLLQRKLSKPKVKLSMISKKHKWIFYKLFLLLKSLFGQDSYCKIVCVPVTPNKICEVCRSRLFVYVAILHRLKYQVSVL